MQSFSLNELLNKNYIKVIERTDNYAGCVVTPNYLINVVDSNNNTTNRIEYIQVFQERNEMVIQCDDVGNIMIKQNMYEPFACEVYQRLT